MARRRKMTRRSSKRSFKRYADRTHVRNLPRTVMRGGYRL